MTKKKKAILTKMKLALKIPLNQPESNQFVINILNDYDIEQTGLNQCLKIACTSNNLEIVTYLLTSSDMEQHANMHYLYVSQGFRCNDGAFLDSALLSQYDVVHYLLYDLNYQISRNTIEYLQIIKRDDVLKLIEKRDLYLKLNEDIKKDNNTEKAHIKV